MLYQVSNEWKCGFMEDFIAHSKDGYTIDSPEVKISFVKIFKYEIESILTPDIASIKNTKYITSGWIPCHPNTELSDIKWIPKISKQEQIKEIDIWKFKSSSGGGEYVTKKNGFKYTCNCPGVWRAKDRECKHIKEVKSYK
jgi:desulfoferrodoxin (superoxide reductase-like protein)